MSVAAVGVAASAAIAAGTAAANSSAAKKGAKTAADATRAGDQAAIEEQQRQFDETKALLMPFVSSGQKTLGGQMDLLGLNGNGAQYGAIGNIVNGSQYEALAKQGEQGILQNAAATGGLRGGNTQGALAQFRPAMLQHLIENQFANLGSLTGIGANSANSLGMFGANKANQVSQYQQDIGQAGAGEALAIAQANIQRNNAYAKAGSSVVGGLSSGEGLAGVKQIAGNF